MLSSQGEPDQPPPSSRSTIAADLSDGETKNDLSSFDPSVKLETGKLSRRRPRRQQSENEKEMHASEVETEVDKLYGPEIVVEDACYPKQNAFVTLRRHSREKLDFEFLGIEDSGINFLNDPPEQMTMGRKIALKLLHKKWYNPRAGIQFQKYEDVEALCEGIPNLPSLQKAWAYFEHVVLTRYVVEPHNASVEGWGWIRKLMYSFKNFDEEFQRAQPGENQRPTKLYDTITTPHKQVRDVSEIQCHLRPSWD